MEAADSSKVQRVNKKSSDELLRKFAELGSDSGDEEAPVKKKELRVAKRQRRSDRKIREEGDSCESPLNINGHIVERKWLLPPAAPPRRSAVLRQLEIGRSRLRARDVKNKSVLGTIQKTWRKTVERASKVFVEKHYNRHRRLINDVV